MAEGGPRDAADASDKQGGTSKAGPGRTCREEALGPSLLYRFTPYHDGGVLLGPNRRGGMLIHLNVLGCMQRLNTRPRRSKHVNNLCRAAGKDLHPRICCQRQIYTG